MKKLFKLSLLAMLAVWTVSCDNGPDDNGNGNGNTPIPDGKAAFTAFGFYAEDNEGVLTEDYIAEKVESRMVLRLPKAVDRTALVARFTTLDDNEVYIGEVLQESGKTANDFTNYVDYVVKQPNTTGIATYEVKAGKILEMKLEHLASYTSEDYILGSGIAGAVSPKDNSYYIFYESEEKDELNKSINRGYVIKWDGTKFSQVGDGPATPAGVNSLDIVIDADGTPYILFINSNRYVDGVADANTNSYASVRKFTGGAWVEVGSDVFGTTGKPNSSYIALGIDPATKNPIVGWQNNTKKISLPHRFLIMNYYSTTGWDADNMIESIKGNLYCIDFKPVGNDLYMGGYIQGGEATPNFFAYKYKGNKGWDNIFTIEGSEVGQSTGTAYKTFFNADSKGNLYFSTSTNPDGTWKASILRYDAESGKLEPVGGDLGIESEAANLVKLSFDGKDNPVLFYKQGTVGIPYLRPLDPNTQQWSAPVAVSDKDASQVMISTDNNGDSYLTFTYKLPNKVEGDTTIPQGYCIETYTFALEEDEE